MADAERRSCDRVLLLQTSKQLAASAHVLVIIQYNIPVSAGGLPLLRQYPRRQLPFSCFWRPVIGSRCNAETHSKPDHMYILCYTNPSCCTPSTSPAKILQPQMTLQGSQKLHTFLTNPPTTVHKKQVLL